MATPGVTLVEGGVGGEMLFSYKRPQYRGLESRTHAGSILAALLRPFHTRLHR
jgi:hypothetical protein